MPYGVGGGGSAANPGWLLRAALASCQATVIAIRAAQLGVDLKVLEVEVGSESDLRGMLALDDRISAGFSNIKVSVRISAEGVDPDRLRAIVEWGAYHAPVGATLRHPSPITFSVEVC
jgi:uncharacterized OsmC-like protein